MEELPQCPGSTGCSRKYSCIYTDVYAVARGFCDPPRIFFRGQWIPVPRDVPEPVGDIIRKTTIPDQDGQIIAGIDIVRIKDREDRFIRLGIKGGKTECPDSVGKFRVEHELGIFKDLRPLPRKPLHQFCMPADLTYEFTGFREETSNAPVVGLPEYRDCLVAEQLHQDIGQIGRASCRERATNTER